MKIKNIFKENKIFFEGLFFLFLVWGLGQFFIKSIYAMFGIVVYVVYITSKINFEKVKQVLKENESPRKDIKDK